MKRRAGFFLALMGTTIILIAGCGMSTQTAGDIKTGGSLTIDAITCLEQLPDGTDPKAAIGICLPKVALENSAELIDLVSQLFQQKHLAMQAESTFAFHKPIADAGDE